MPVANFDITSANAEGILTVEEIFPAGIVLQMFATDQGITQDATQKAEARMGVDGKMVAGYTPVIKNVTIKLEASSPSAEALAIYAEAMATNRRVYPCHLVCTVPSIKVVYTWRVGTLLNGNLFPDMLPVLAPTTWQFAFESFERSKL